MHIMLMSIKKLIEQANYILRSINFVFAIGKVYFNTLNRPVHKKTLQLPVYTATAC
jgi:hypothetical protein